MVLERVLEAAGFAVAGPAAVDPVVRAVRRRGVISRDLEKEYDERATLGERLADRVAEVGGSWGFVGAFAAFLVVWAGVNLAAPAGERFDPYPFIFLNLLLSMLAAVQAPIIMMSQNRQAAKDRRTAQHDYEINLKAELEILTLHEKLDALHREHSAELKALRTLLEEARDRR